MRVHTSRAAHGIAGLTKTVALEGATFGITANAICPGYVWTPLVERQIPETMEARHLTREQVINDVLLDAQPTKQFVTVEEIAAYADVPRLRRGQVDHRRDPVHRRRLDRGIGPMKPDAILARWPTARCDARSRRTISSPI